MNPQEAMLIVQVAESVAPEIINAVRSIIANHKANGVADDQLAAAAIAEFNSTQAAATKDAAADKA